jgi:hypothetical protein
LKLIWSALAGAQARHDGLEDIGSTGGALAVGVGDLTSGATCGLDQAGQSALRDFGDVWRAAVVRRGRSSREASDSEDRDEVLHLEACVNDC